MGGKEGKQLPPKSDPNSPDLYIPLMAFLTYVLMAGVTVGSMAECVRPPTIVALWYSSVPLPGLVIQLASNSYVGDATPLTTYTIP